MNNRRSYLDAINAGRRRRPSASLEQLSNTLDELESRINRSSYDDRRPLGRDEDALRHRAAPQPPERWSPRADHHVAEELTALREELRNQMGAGLKREFSTLREEIERAMQASGGSGQAAGLGAEFERLSGMIQKLAEKSDDRQVNLLRLEMEEVKGALGKLAREETLTSFDRRWDEFDRRWSDVASKVSAAEQDKDASGVAIQALTTRLEQIGDAIGDLPNSVALRSLEDRMKVLSSAVERFAHQQDRITPETLDAIEDRLNEISRAVAASAASARTASFDPEPFERIEARISSLSRQLGEIVEENPANLVVDQLAALAHRVEDLAHRVEVPDHVVSRLAERIESITYKLDQGPAAPDLDAVLNGLESRFSALSSMLEQRHDDALTQGQTLFRDLERRLEDVAARIDDSRPAADTPDLLAAMDTRFADLASRFERQASAPADDRVIRDIEARLETISSRIDASARGSVDPDLIRSLETQIAGLATHLSQPAPVSDGAEIRPRLDRIEQSIAESRQDVMEAARRAAEEAVRGFSGSSADATLVAGLADDLKALDELARRSDDRNARTFEAIHDTLLKIVDRLGAIETARSNARDTIARTPALDPVEAMPLAEPEDQEPEDQEPVAQAAAHPRRRTAATAAAEAAADAARGQEEGGGRRSVLGGLTRALSGRKVKAAEQAEPRPHAEASAVDQQDAEVPAIEIDPPLDPKVANRPLEPGSGAPDLNAIMKRVRDERGQPARGPETDAAKSDFIAAARRAAQAAAAEAEIMKRSPSVKGKSEKFSLGRLLGRKRKPLLMGVAAVLIALAALQGGRFLLGGGDTAEAPAPVAQQAMPEGEVAMLEEPVAQDEPVEAASPPPALDEPAADLSPSVTDQPVRLVGEAGPATARSMMASAPQSADEVTTDWLDPDTTAAAPAAEQTAAPEELVAANELPEPSEEMLASIPDTAGPIALREAAAAGDPKALFEIGNRYAEGRGVQEDMAAAAEWYERAAEQGLAPAQYRIGNLYEKGMGVARDVASAKTWYQLAAAQGNASAMHNLAVLYAMGADGVADNESAARWFTEASEFGVRDSQYNLGILSAKGVGMPQDLQAAYKWFALVAKAGDKDAAEKRDEVARALSPEQLETARADAELWRARPLDAEANNVDIPESWGEGPETTASIDMREAVRNIQQILNAGGYDAGSEDGLMGRKTSSAIAAFQKDNGMEPTGEIDERLVRALLEKR